MFSSLFLVIFCFSLLSSFDRAKANLIVIGDFVVKVDAQIPLGGAKANLIINTLSISPLKAIVQNLQRVRDPKMLNNRAKVPYFV